MTLSKNALLGRNDKGELVPVEVDVPELGGKVFMTPVTRGDLIQTESEIKAGSVSWWQTDLNYIKKHLVSPKLSEEEYKELPHSTVRALVENLMVASGVAMKKEQTTSGAVAEAEAELQKKSV